MLRARVKGCGCAVSASILFSAACGYVGPVLPPSPEIPTPITDVTAAERGDQIVINFTTPPRTTDGVAITRFSNIDLRVGPEDQSPDKDKSFDVEPPAPSDKDDPQPKPISYSIKVSDWVGQKLAVQVRTEVKTKGHFSSWSNKAVVQVIPPLTPPLVHVEANAKGFLLTWPAANGVTYRVQRQGPNDKQPLELATVAGGEYLDTSAQYDTQYSYVVTALEDRAESLPSEPVQFSAEDKFAPAVPTGLSVLAGPDEVNVAWQRNTESDLQGYFVYRSTDHGAYEKQDGLDQLPTYVDRKVEHGKTYSYKVSAIDKKGNESAQSAAAEVQY